MLRAVIPTLAMAGVCAGQTLLLLDRSGSMARQYEGGIVDWLAAPLFDSLQGAGKVEAFGFSSAVAQGRPLDAAGINAFRDTKRNPVAGSTQLDDTVDFAVDGDYAIAWVLTDNIQSAGQDNGDTGEFYRKLRSDQVQRVTFFPILGQNKLRGVVVYALLLEESQAESYFKQIDAFVAAMRGKRETEALKMKPLDREAIEVKVVTPPARRPNQRYKLGVPIAEQFQVQFSSKLDHLEIVEGDLVIPETRPVFGEDSIFSAVNEKADINPTKVYGLGPRETLHQLYTVDVKVDALDYRTDLASLLSTLTKPGEVGHLELKMDLNVSRDDFRLRKDFLEKYDLRDGESPETGKIYGIAKLPEMMTSDVTPISVVHPFELPVDMPQWPAAVVIVGSLALLAALVALVLWAVKKLKPGVPKWKVTTMDGSGQTLPAGIGKEGTLVVDKRTIGSVTREGFFPTGGCSLADGQISAAIVPDREIQLNSLDFGSLRVTFSKQGGAAPKSEAATHIPTRR